jgi:FAD/FMN-containing dehydrogenase
VIRPRSSAEVAEALTVARVAAGRSARFDAAWDRVRPAMDGLYLSFESAFSPARLADAFPEPALSRLRALKAAVDPDGVFDQNFPVSALTSGTTS